MQLPNLGGRGQKCTVMSTLLSLGCLLGLRWWWQLPLYTPVLGFWGRDLINLAGIPSIGCAQVRRVGD